MTPPTRTILVFARVPERGRVKTRLAAELGDGAALQVYRGLGLRTLAAARSVAGAEVVVCFTPAPGAHRVREWLGEDVALRPQREGDLGERMAHAVGEALASGAREVVVVGTDCPELDAETIEAAFGRLRGADVVLGPALDGGYYLIGMRRAHPELFAGIPWSTSETLAATLAAARRAGLGVALLPALRDVDTAADWAAWRAGETARERLRT